MSISSSIVKSVLSSVVMSSTVMSSTVMSSTVMSIVSSTMMRNSPEREPWMKTQVRLKNCKYFHLQAWSGGSINIRATGAIFWVWFCQYSCNRRVLFFPFFVVVVVLWIFMWQGVVFWWFYQYSCDRICFLLQNWILHWPAMFVGRNGLAHDCIETCTSACQPCRQHQRHTAKHKMVALMALLWWLSNISF